MFMFCTVCKTYNYLFLYMHVCVFYVQSICLFTFTTTCCIFCCLCILYDIYVLLFNIYVFNVWLMHVLHYTSNYNYHIHIPV